ncbi:MAG: hypothetical protein IJ684_03020 [Bacteroidales bacterium]|nr:hypothetical protein [Bacteroidales bacterium]
MDWTSIILGIITLLGGCGWIVDRHKHRQEVEGLKADNRQKDMDLSKDYVEAFRKEIAEPLRREVRELKREVKKLNNAINKIQDCPHAGDCPVYDELQKQQADSGAEADGEGQ